MNIYDPQPDLSQQYLEVCRDRIVLPKSRALADKQQRLGARLTAEERRSLERQAFAIEHGMKVPE